MPVVLGFLAIVTRRSGAIASACGQPANRQKLSNLEDRLLENLCQGNAIATDFEAMKQPIQVLLKMIKFAPEKNFGVAIAA